MRLAFAHDNIFQQDEQGIYLVEVVLIVKFGRGI